MAEQAKTKAVILGTSIGNVLTCAASGGDWTPKGHVAQLFITNVLNVKVTFSLTLQRSGVDYYMRINEPLEAYSSFPGTICLFLEEGDNIRGVSSQANAVHVVVSGVQGRV